MTAAVSPTRTRAVSARTLGALAVAGVVIAFSLSSTLVKRAESPGVLVAVWRLTVATIVWNSFLWSTGRRVTMRDVRQALIARRLLRSQSRHLLRRGDAQQRGERRADRFARSILDRADRRLAVHGVQRSACARVRAGRVRGCRHRVVQCTSQGGRVVGGQRVRFPCDVAVGGLRGVDAALSPGHGCRRVHGDDLSDRGCGRASAGDRQWRRVRDDRHRGGRTC